MHFVAHSLGGLIVLNALDLDRNMPPGRIVLAGVPFGRSYAADRLCRLPGGRAVLGRSMGEWLAGAGRRLSVGREIGIIAGNVPFGLGRMVVPELPLPSDGAVSVEETAVPGMCDRIVLPVSHSGMLVSSAVARQICAFLRDGAFAR
jgi:hypothetical protein